MDLRARQQLNQGYADTLARGFEFAAVPVVFGGIGWLLDRQFGTSPLFTIALVVFGFAGMFAKLWIGYDAAMKREEAGAVWSRSRTRPGPGSSPTPGEAP
jgi:F0F1-type ATP synthase assembly protein I